LNKKNFRQWHDVFVTALHNSFPIVGRAILPFMLSNSLSIKRQNLAVSTADGSSCLTAECAITKIN